MINRPSEQKSRQNAARAALIATGVFAMKDFVRTPTAFAPETRTSAMAPSPGGVETGKHVSENVITLAKL